VARLSATAGVGEAEVAVLAERSIYILNESGQCVMQASDAGEQANGEIPNRNLPRVVCASL
jgi:hypothetical protein